MGNISTRAFPGTAARDNRCMKSFTFVTNGSSLDSIGGQAYMAANVAEAAELHGPLVQLRDLVNWGVHTV